MEKQLPRISRRMFREVSMLLGVITLLFLSTLGVSRSSEASERYSVGFTEIKIISADRELNTFVWYPVPLTQATSLIAENVAFHGFPGVKDGIPAQGRFPLVVLSHGVNGTGVQYAWLAAALAERGAVVAAPLHPGTNFKEKKSQNTAKLWERPRDMTRVIDALFVDKKWSEFIDFDHVIAMGHSMGGYTALALAGGRFDADRFNRYCELNPNNAPCLWYDGNSVGKSEADAKLLGQNLADKRVKAVVLMDLGFTQAMTPESLAVVDIPVLVLGAGAEGELSPMPVSGESRTLASLLPPRMTTYKEIKKASHFSFFRVCKPEAAALLKEESPGDEVICEDGPGADRSELHAEILNLILDFIGKSSGGSFR